MTAVRMITVSVEYDEDEPEDVLAVDSLTAEFEELIAKAGLSLDNIEQEDIS
jgi:hypothetical protein